MTSAYMEGQLELEAQRGRYEVIEWLETSGSTEWKAAAAALRSTWPVVAGTPHPRIDVDALLHEERIETTRHAKEHWAQVLAGLDKFGMSRKFAWIRVWVQSNERTRAMLETEAILEMQPHG